jgi:hypothetical protein
MHREEPLPEAILKPRTHGREKFIHVALSEEESINRRLGALAARRQYVLGRMDNTGKIKGIPNQVGEIESQLSKIHNVEQSIVELKGKKATNIW